MSKFKKGDRVKVREWDDLAEQYGLTIGGHIKTPACCFVERMREYCGKNLTVKRVWEDGVNLEEAGSWNFALDTIRLVDEERKFKFKVGDKVIGNEKAGKRHSITGEGWTGVVTSASKNDFSAENAETGEYYHLEYDCFDLFENNSGKKIVIHIDGKKTIAELYEGEKVVKTKIAKCNDGDEFNFETGAKIAFDELLERVTGDTPYLTCNEIYNSPSYGVIGTPTKYKDVLGRALFVGDTVDLFTEGGDCIDEVAVVETEAEGQFVMGIACDCNQKEGTTGHWKILKKRSYKDVECGETVGMIDYVDKGAK